MDRRTSAQLLKLRSHLTQALVAEAPVTHSAARERILEQGFFESPKTPTPARVISLAPPVSSLRHRPRF